MGTSAVDQARKFGRTYILPVCGNLRISRLNEGHLQRVLNLSAQKGCLRQDTHRPSKGPLSLKSLRGLRNIEQQFVKWCRINGYTALALEVGETTSGKKQNAGRTFGLNSFARRIVEQQLELLHAIGMPTAPESPLFPAINQQSRYHQWKSYARSNGITAISCYEMRHTFISLAQNLPEGDLRRLCGQSASMDTRGVYAHKLCDDDTRIAGEVDQILGRYLDN